MRNGLPGPGPMSALKLAAILCVWLGVFGPAFAFDLHRWQTLVGALITGAGVLVAAWNVTRQMRLTATIPRIRPDRKRPSWNAKCFLPRRPGSTKCQDWRPGESAC